MPPTSPRSGPASVRRPARPDGVAVARAQFWTRRNDFNALGAKTVPFDLALRAWRPARRLAPGISKRTNVEQPHRLVKKIVGRPRTRQQFFVLDQSVRQKPRNSEISVPGERRVAVTWAFRRAAPLAPSSFVISALLALTRSRGDFRKLSPLTIHGSTTPRPYARSCDIAPGALRSGEPDEKLSPSSCVDDRRGGHDGRGLCRLVRLRRCRRQADADSKRRGRGRRSRERAGDGRSCSRCPRGERGLSFLPRGNGSRRVRRRTAGHSRATDTERRIGRLRRQPERARRFDVGRDCRARFQNLDRRDGDARRNRADGLGTAPQWPAGVAGALVSRDCGIL